jgi:hypothetical protein
MLSVALFYCHAECRYAECRYAERTGAVHSVELLHHSLSNQATLFFYITEEQIS